MPIDNQMSAEHLKWHREWQPCDFCQGSGSIPATEDLDNEAVLECPVCLGEGGEETQKPY